MAPREPPSYYFYGSGHEPSSLTLGHLVLGPYERPLLTGRYYNNRVLPDSELNQWATTYELQGSYTPREGLRHNFLVNIANSLNIKYSDTRAFEITVNAKTGKKVQLKSPEDFLRSKLLEDTATVDQLALWFSAARSHRLAAFRRTPKIWLLTGLIQLEDVEVSTYDSRNPSFGAGFSTEALEAAGGPSVGASIGRDRENTSISKVHIAEPLIWAARYHLLKISQSKDENPEPSGLASKPSFRLFPDITSKGHFRGEANQSSLRFDLSIGPVASGIGHFHVQNDPVTALDPETEVNTADTDIKGEPLSERAQRSDGNDNAYVEGLGSSDLQRELQILQVEKVTEEEEEGAYWNEFLETIALFELMRTNDEED